MPTVDAGMVEFLSHYTDRGVLSLIIFVLAGALLTIIVHSSSASMAITLTMAHNGLLPLEAAAAMVMGSNIGTTIDAFLASIGANVNARRAAQGPYPLQYSGSRRHVSFVFNPFLAHGKRHRPRGRDHNPPGHVPYPVQYPEHPGVHRLCEPDRQAG